MKPPRFWHSPPGIASFLLAPLGALYGLATARRVRKEPDCVAKIPIICVGNINAGGTGKTPTVIALVMHLQGLGYQPHIVSRGYGGRITAPTRVDERTHTATDTGDEPLLLAAFCPTWISRNRADGVRLAQQAGAEVIVLDDGFQNPSVRKDLSIVVVDASIGFGNGYAIPAGPLRETVPNGLARADMVLSIGSVSAQSKFDTQWGTQINCPHVTGELVPLETGMDWSDLDVLAFAGIGHPEKFFLTLRALGANLIRTEALDDHQPFTDKLLQRLEADARTSNAQLVTTEKDAVRLPAQFRKNVLTVPVRLQLDDWTTLDAALGKIGLNVSSTQL